MKLRRFDKTFKQELFLLEIPRIPNMYWCSAGYILVKYSTYLPSYLYTTGFVNNAYLIILLVVFVGESNCFILVQRLWNDMHVIFFAKIKFYNALKLYFIFMSL